MSPCISTRATIVLFPILVWFGFLQGTVCSLSASASSPNSNVHVPVVPAPVPVRARLLVLDTLVPGQRLRFTDDTVSVPASFRELCETSQDPLIVVGRQGLSLHSRGMQVFVQQPADADSSSSGVDGDTTFTLSAATGRICDIYHEGEDEGSRWAGRQGTVQFLPLLEDDDLALSPNDYSDGNMDMDTNSIPDEKKLDQITRVSESLGELFLEWEQLVRNTARERFPGHLDGVFRDLGDMPQATSPNARALWIAGFINPLPALGVALEIRPSVLTARSTERRLLMVDQGLRDSIARLQKPGPCF
jgi:hypothetical protein